MGDPVQYMGLIEAKRAMDAHMEGAGPGTGRAEPVRPERRRAVLVAARRRAGLALVWCGRALLQGAAPAHTRPACKRA